AMVRDRMTLPTRSFGTTFSSEQSSHLSGQPILEVKAASLISAAFLVACNIHSRPCILCA
ncbi:MAG: hypothetical protein ACI8PV_002036, partial [Dinoroseobacter sp.]